MDTGQCMNVMISGNIFSTRLVKKFWLFKQNERYFTTTRPFLGNLLSHCRKKPFSSTGKKWNKSVKKEWNRAEDGEIKKKIFKVDQNTAYSGMSRFACQDRNGA